MKCLGCYTETKDSYCLSCRRVLFDKVKVGSELGFGAPAANNLGAFQQYSKQLSISGVQLKYSLHLEEKQLVLTEKAGQYLLKPIPPARHLLHVEEVPENEHLTMQIAKQVFKIDTAMNGLLFFNDKQPAYFTRRFDVKHDGTKYLQEDFAQLTNRTQYSHGEAFKYSGTYEEIGILIRRYVAAAMPALEKFFQLVVFNYVISNGDAHLKNFSLIRDDNGEYSLTPAYDLISTVIHTPHEADTALDLYPGDIDSDYYQTYGHYGRPDFMELSRRLGIMEKRAERILDFFCTNENNVFALIEKSFLSEPVKKLYCVNFIDKIARIQPISA